MTPSTVTIFGRRFRRRDRATLPETDRPACGHSITRGRLSRDKQQASHNMPTQGCHEDQWLVEDARTSACGKQVGSAHATHYFVVRNPSNSDLHENPFHPCVLEVL